MERADGQVVERGAKIARRRRIALHENGEMRPLRTRMCESHPPSEENGRGTLGREPFGHDRSDPSERAGHHIESIAFAVNSVSKGQADELARGRVASETLRMLLVDDRRQCLAHGGR